MVKNPDGSETISYCKCGQAVRFRKKDNTWVHYGWKRMNEPYAWFLDRTNHPVEIKETITWKSPCVTIVE